MGVYVNNYNVMITEQTSEHDWIQWTISFEVSGNSDIST